MIEYPTALPQPSVSLTGNADTPTVRTDLETGLIQQAGRFATGKETYSLLWTLSTSELDIFEDFFNNTLAGGVLIFGLLLPDDGEYVETPVRFVGGNFTTRHKSALFWSVSATVERMVVSNAPTNRTLVVPPWMRLAVDEAVSQNLNLAHRNALLTVRPDAEDQTALRIYPPIDSTQYIYFGINNLGDGETLITSDEVDPLPVADPPVWPSSLPLVNLAFNISSERKVNRLEMDSGHSRQFAKFTRTVNGYEVAWDFTLGQLQDFQDFFYVTLESGTLPFYLDLPVDGIYDQVLVRFAGGVYNESYLPVDIFRVTAQLDRVTGQAVEILEAYPYALYYSPSEEVSESRKIAWSDEGKFFICDPDLLETIDLHIGNKEIEFGILVIGLGNVRITRDPWPFVFGPFEDSGSGDFLAPVFSLESAIAPLDPIDEDGEGEFSPPVFDLVDVLVPVSVGDDESSGEFSAPILALRSVFIDAGPLDDSGTGVFAEPTFALEIP